MSLVIENEWKKWIATLEKESLSKYDVTLINIIQDNFTAIASVGAAAGKRAKLVASLIESKSGVLDDQLEKPRDNASTSSLLIKKIDSMHIESFRGFSIERDFDFSKQYVLFYGPNGSGKSSLTEAIEYALTDTIEEADSRRISVGKYIQNNNTQKGIRPNVVCTYSDGSKGQVISNFDNYRFAFIEKNRIDNFSRIDAVTEKNQLERMAALFGVAKFNSFVREFGETIEKYLNIENRKKVEFEKEQATYKQSVERIQEIIKLLDELKESGKQAVASIFPGEEISVEDAINKINDEKTGILIQLLIKKKESTIPLISNEDWISIASYAKAWKETNCYISEMREQLTNRVLDVNYIELYNAVITLPITEFCPACATPLTMTKINPYEVAVEKLKELKDIAETKERLQSEYKKLFQVHLQLKERLQFSNALVNIMGFDATIFKETDSEDIRSNKELVEKISSFIETIIIKDKDRDFIDEKIREYNCNAAEKNKQYDEQISKWQKSLSLLQTIVTSSNNLKMEKSTIQKKIDEFDTNNKDKLNEISQEDSQVAYNKEMLAAYVKFRTSIMDYTEKLPITLASNLSDKVRDYYNVINQDDADYEKIDILKLPQSADDRITIKFGDGLEADALQVLSEGHVKILGLAMLMAKAHNEHQSFLVFDDIVNAIDDDHRNGVADLIINSPDFTNVQVILTCHGEQFIMKMEDKIPSNKRQSIVRYVFLSADSLEERGIVAEDTDAKAPLIVAENKIRKGELKDAASKCRQATECLINNLWKKVCKYTGLISVGMRNPGGKPDLSSIVDGLIKHIKSISGAEEIYNELTILKSKYNWMLLNKGTHFESDQPEFEHTDIKNLVSLLNDLNEKIKMLNLTVKA